MKKKTDRLHHYRRLYTRLFFLYAEKTRSSYDAKNEADGAFFILTGLNPDEVIRKQGD